MAQINKPTDYFRTKLYAGNASNRSITFDESTNMQPDLVWIKSRTNAEWHHWVDAVRGTTSNIYSNSTNSADTDNDRVTAFGTNGFSLGVDDGVNNASETFVAWNWKANGAGSANTDGSTNSTVSVNTTAGFSIVKYTGSGANATIGHGLGAVPKMIIVKNLTEANYDWMVYHQTLGNGSYIRLNLTSDKSNGSVWQSTTPTSSVFSVVSNSSDVNKSGNDFIAYCFAEKKGFSQINSYEGNGNADGTFVYTGFKPAFVMFKKTDVTGTSWGIFDNKRDVDNVAQKFLQPNDSGAEESGDRVDFLSNGFKLRTNWTVLNSAGNTFIYMAFAENPIVGSNNIPAVAR